MTSDPIISIVRTIVPAVVGSGVAWLAARGVDIDGAAATALVTTLATAGYYGAVRWAEGRWPRAGWLLGIAAPPSYYRARDPEA